MEREFLHLERILTVYDARGQEALKALEDEDWATFEELMRKRRAAFHNFRAWDDRLEKQASHPEERRHAGSEDGVA
jgi:hypothetical protein